MEYVFEEDRFFLGLPRAFWLPYIFLGYVECVEERENIVEPCFACGLLENLA